MTNHLTLAALGIDFVAPKKNHWQIVYTQSMSGFIIAWCWLSKVDYLQPKDQLAKMIKGLKLAELELAEPKADAWILLGEHSSKQAWPDSLDLSKVHKLDFGFVVAAPSLFEIKFDLQKKAQFWHLWRSLEQLLA